MYWATRLGAQDADVLPQRTHDLIAGRLHIGA
jgi:hypothetical protein